MNDFQFPKSAGLGYGLAQWQLGHGLWGTEEIYEESDSNTTWIKYQICVQDQAYKNSYLDKCKNNGKQTRTLL